MAQRVGGRGFGQAQRAAQALHGQLDDARRQRAASLADEQRPFRPHLVGAQLQIAVDGGADRGDDGHGAHLAALAQHGHAIHRAAGGLRAGDRQGLGNAQARSIEQAQHRRVAGQHPWRAGLALARLAAGHRAGGARRKGFWQGAGDLGGAHGAQGRGLAPAFAFQMPRERADARQTAQQRPALHPLRPAPRHIGAHIGWLEPGKGRHVRRFAQMGRQKAEKLSQVALVGVQRMRGGAALARQMGEPAPGLMGERGRASGKDQVVPVRALCDRVASRCHGGSLRQGS